MRSSINLASSPFVNYRGFVLTAGLLAVAALSLTVWVGAEGIRAWREGTANRARVRELEDRRAQLAAEQKQLELELQAPGTREVLDRARFFNQLIEQKRLSWTQLFFDLQERLPTRARILSLSPRLRADGLLQVELRVGSESPEVLIEFLHALEEGDKFREITLDSQSTEAVSRGDALVAEVRAVYVQE